jgi:2-methylcitrate dehydratase PrpD
VRSIECRVNPLVPEILVHHVTQRGLEGKFSMEYSVAVCLLDGRAGLAQYTDARASDPALDALMRKVHVLVDESIPVNLAYFPSIVTVALEDGRAPSARVDVPEGYPQRPLATRDVLAKVHDCCEGVLSGGRIDALIEAVLHLEDVADVAEVAALLAGDVGSAP